jgi:hypothetical protein
LAAEALHAAGAVEGKITKSPACGSAAQTWAVSKVKVKFCPEAVPETVLAVNPVNVPLFVPETTLASIGE